MKLSLIKDEEERSIYPFKEPDNHDFNARTLNGAISYNTSKIIHELRFIRQKEYPIHLTGDNAPGFILIYQGQRTPCIGFMPGCIRVHERMDYIGPSYINLYLWAAVPDVNNIIRGDKHQKVAEELKEHGERFSKNISEETLAKLNDGRNWLATSKSSLFGATLPKS